jgi:hypothetical protein
MAVALWPLSHSGRIRPFPQLNSIRHGHRLPLLIGAVLCAAVTSFLGALLSASVDK